MELLRPDDMTRVVSTWFYQQERDEGGSYAQVRGDASTEAFRDVYRRCLAVFFSTARRVEPDARLVLYLNEPWDPAATAVSDKVDVILRRLGVAREVLDYTFSPPPSWPAAWRNQFFVFDALRSLGQASLNDDVVVLLDSDIVWTGAPTGESMWAHIANRGALTYRIGYGTDQPINGCSRRQLTALGEHLGLQADRIIDYSGGEYVGARGDMCRELVAVAEQLWPSLIEQQSTGGFAQIEEAHLLSLCYAALGIEAGTADPFVKRMWTQPLKPRNVRSADVDFPLWHLPAEKKYGIRRLYAETLQPDASIWTCPVDEYRRRLGRSLGVPRNSVRKVAADVSLALVERGRLAIRRG